MRVALEKRGGFKELCSRESSGPISFELRFRQQPDSPLATYYLEVAIRDNKPIVSREILKYRRGQHGQPWHFLDFENGVGRAIRNENSYFAGEENVK